MNAANLLVRCLEAEGVTHVFGIPGEENLVFLEALRASSITLVLTRHEQAAGFMAATYGRLTGRPGVCLSTLGPGATNLVTAVAYARLGGMPVMVVTGQKPIKRNKQGQFQILDVVRMMEPLTKWSRQAHSGEAIPSLVREAFRLAMAEKPGPVHLELPEDIAAEEVCGEPHMAAHTQPPLARQAIVEEAAHHIRAARRPLVLMAAGAGRPGVSAALRHFLDVTGMYFFCTQMGKGAVDQRHRLSLGTAALSDHDYLHCAIARADCIINVGHDVVEKPPFFMRHGDERTVIHVHAFPAQVDDVYFPQVEVAGDMADSLRRLADALGPLPHMDNGYFTRIKSYIDAHVYGAGLAETFPLTPQRVALEVREAMPEDGVLTLDNGMFKLWFARNYRAYAPHTLLLDNALATMGAGLPSALSVALLRPARPVATLCGDGGFMMSAQELETAVRLKLNLTVIVLRDDGYGMIKWKQAGMGLPVYGLDFGNPDFVRFAESFGATGHRVAAPGQLRDMLAACLGAPGVHLIEAPVDYSENEKVLLEELREKTCLL